MTRKRDRRRKKGSLVGLLIFEFLGLAAFYMLFTQARFHRAQTQGLPPVVDSSVSVASHPVKEAPLPSVGEDFRSARNQIQDWWQRGSQPDSQDWELVERR